MYLGMTGYNDIGNRPFVIVGRRIWDLLALDKDQEMFRLIQSAGMMHGEVYMRHGCAVEEKSRAQRRTAEKSVGRGS